MGPEEEKIIMGIHKHLVCGAGIQVVWASHLNSLMGLTFILWSLHYLWMGSGRIRLQEDVLVSGKHLNIG